CRASMAPSGFDPAIPAASRTSVRPLPRLLRPLYVCRSPPPSFGSSLHVRAQRSSSLNSTIASNSFRDSPFRGDLEPGLHSRSDDGHTGELLRRDDRRPIPSSRCDCATQRARDLPCVVAGIILVSLVPNGALPRPTSFDEGCL